MSMSMARTFAMDGDRTLNMEAGIRVRMAEMTAVENEVDRIEAARVAKLKAEAEEAAEAGERRPAVARKAGQHVEGGGAARRVDHGAQQRGQRLGPA